MPIRQQAIIWSIIAALFLAALWWMGNVMLPFVLGAVIAYLLDPVADRMQAVGMPRLLAVILIALVAILILALAILLIIPTLLEQTIQLIDFAPQAIAGFQDWLTTRFPGILDEGSTVREQLTRIGATIQERGGELLQGLLSSAMSFINVLVILFIAPVVAFYLLLDWDRMMKNLDDLLPRDHAPTIRRIAKEMDRTLAGFLRGQGMVCLILGVFYAGSLMLAGLNFGLVIGSVAGLISFIPYIGSLVGGGLSIGVALFQFWGDWVQILLIVGIFAFGQVVEGNFLSPKMVGDSVGLHPVWLILALSVFGTLFGFLGMLVAVPVAAIIGVLIRFFVARYKEGRLYQGHSGPEQTITHVPPVDL